MLKNSEDKMPSSAVNSTRFYGRELHGVFGNNVQYLQRETCSQIWTFTRVSSPSRMLLPSPMEIGVTILWIMTIKIILIEQDKFLIPTRPSKALTLCSDLWVEFENRIFNWVKVWRGWRLLGMEGHQAHSNGGGKWNTKAEGFLKIIRESP